MSERGYLLCAIIVLCCSLFQSTCRNETLSKSRDEWKKLANDITDTNVEIVKSAERIADLYQNCMTNKSK